MKLRTHMIGPFLSAMTWFLLGVCIIFAGIMYSFLGSYGSWFWWMGPPTILFGIVLTYVIGVRDLRKFWKTLPDYTESSDEYEAEHSFGTRKSKRMYDEETLAEKRP